MIDKGLNLLLKALDKASKRELINRAINEKGRTVVLRKKHNVIIKRYKKSITVITDIINKHIQLSFLIQQIKNFPAMQHKFKFNYKLLLNDIEEAGYTLIRWTVKEDILKEKYGDDCSIIYRIKEISPAILIIDKNIYAVQLLFDKGDELKITNPTEESLKRLLKSYDIEKVI